MFGHFKKKFMSSETILAVLFDSVKWWLVLIICSKVTLQSTMKNFSLLLTGDSNMVLEQIFKTLTTISEILAIISQR